MSTDEPFLVIVSEITSKLAGSPDHSSVSTLEGRHFGMNIHPMALR